MTYGSAIRSLILALLVFTWAGAAAAQSRLDLLAFRDAVAAEIRRQQPGARIVLAGRVGLEVTAPGEDEPRIQSLERAHALYLQDPSRLNELVGIFSRSFLPAPITPQSLRVLVRREGANPPAGPQGTADRGLVRPIAGGLIAIVAVDGPDAYEFLRASVLRRRLGLEDAAIWTRALANTRALIAFKPRTLTPGQLARLESQGLSSSLLADDAFWDAPAMTAQGPLVVAAPGRDEIFILLLRDTALVAQVRQALADVANDADTLFAGLLVRRNGRWEVLK